MKFALPVLASVGLLTAILTIFICDNTREPSVAGVSVPSPPYRDYVAGSGVIEAEHGNIRIGSPTSGVVAQVMVNAGDLVHAGEPLFRLDNRDLQAELTVAEAQLKVADAEVQQPQHQLDYDESLLDRDPGAVSARDLSRLRDQLAIAKANQQLAEARVAQVKIGIERHLVRAPVTGKILRSTLRPGEYIAAAGASPLLLFGEDSTLYLRVDVNESDAWRVHPGAAAVAYVRSSPDIRVPLQFEYIQPYVVPKTALTGQSTERSDTRVLQVVYSFVRDGKPLYVGQQMDVFIQSTSDKNGGG